MTQVIGWTKNGVEIEAPEGINVADYFRDGRYIGPDEDGVEPVLADGVKEVAAMIRFGSCNTVVSFRFATYASPEEIETAKAKASARRLAAAAEADHA